MSELIALEADEIDIFDRNESESVLADVDVLLSSIHSDEIRLATGYARLGRKLFKVQHGKHWMGRFASFGKYIDYVKERIHKERSAIYSYLSVTEKLLPSVSEADMEKMGISRAQELARFVKQSGRKVPQDLLLLALDPQSTISELHTKVLESLNERGEVSGKWWDPFGGGSYFTDDEKKEIQQAIECARAMNPSDSPEHVQRKDVILALAREFVSSYPEGLNV